MQRIANQVRLSRSDVRSGRAAKWSVARQLAALTFALPLLLSFAKSEAANDASKGEQYFRACVACHSLTPDHNMTGPSLAGVFGRKAGTLASFNRFSSALQASGVVWNEQTLDAWLAGPTHFIPDSRMPFEGI